MSLPRRTWGIGMKKVIAVVFFVFLAGILIVIGSIHISSQEKNKIESIKIGVSVYNQYDTFIASLMEQLKSCAAQKENETGIEIIVDIVNAAGSQPEQNDQVEKFVKNGYDVVCVNLVDRTDPTLIIDKAESAGIPIIFFNRELVPEDLKRYDKAYYVGAVTIEPGIMQGEMIADLLAEKKESIDKNADNKIQYIMLEGEAGHQDAIIRTEYAVNTIVEKGIQVEKLDYALANWNRDQGKSKMDKLIEQFGNEIEVVISNNDDMALGAIDAYIDKERLENMPVIVGIDGTLAGLTAVKEGYMYGTAYNDGVGQGRSLLELSYALKTGQNLPEDIIMTEEKYIRYSYKKVTKENVDEFISIHQ